MVYEIQTTTETKWTFRNQVFNQYDIEFERAFEAESGYDEDGSITRTFFPATYAECPCWQTKWREFYSIAIPIMKKFRVNDKKIMPDGGIKLPAYRIKWWMNDNFELSPRDFEMCDESYTLYNYKAENLGEE